VAAAGGSVLGTFKVEAWPLVFELTKNTETSYRLRVSTSDSPLIRYALDTSAEVDFLAATKLMPFLYPVARYDEEPEGVERASQSQKLWETLSEVSSAVYDTLTLYAGLHPELFIPVPAARGTSAVTVDSRAGDFTPALSVYSDKSDTTEAGQGDELKPE